MLQDIAIGSQRCLNKAIELQAKDPDGFFAPITSGALIRSAYLWINRIESNIDECLEIINTMESHGITYSSCSDACDQTTKSVSPAQTGM
jgi:hypothetical protein